MELEGLETAAPDLMVSESLRSVVTTESGSTATVIVQNGTVLVSGDFCRLSDTKEVLELVLECRTSTALVAYDSWRTGRSKTEMVIKSMCVSSGDVLYEDTAPHRIVDFDIHETAPGTCTVTLRLA